MGGMNFGGFGLMENLFEEVCDGAGELDSGWSA